MARDRPVESSLFPFVLYHVGFHVPTLSLNTELAVAIFHDVIAYQAGCRRTDPVSILVDVARLWLVVGRSGRFGQIAEILIGIAQRKLGSVWAQQYADWWPFWDSGRLLAGRVARVLNSLRSVIFWSLGWRDVAVRYKRRWSECVTFSVRSFSAFVSSCCVSSRESAGGCRGDREPCEQWCYRARTLIRVWHDERLLIVQNKLAVAEVNGVVIHLPLASTHTFLPCRPAYPEAWRQYEIWICSLSHSRERKGFTNFKK